MTNLFSIELWIATQLFINLVLAMLLWRFVKKLKKVEGDQQSSIKHDDLKPLKDSIHNEVLQKIEKSLHDIGDKAAVDMVDRAAQDIIDLLEPLVKGSESAATSFDNQIKDKQRIIKGLNDALDARIISINLLLSRAEIVLNSKDKSIYQQKSSRRDNASGLRDNASGLRDNTSGLRDNASGLRDNSSGLRDNSSGLRDNSSDLRDNSSGLRNNPSGLRDNTAELRKNSFNPEYPFDSRNFSDLNNTYNPNWVSGEKPTQDNFIDQQQRIIEWHKQGLDIDTIASKLSMPRGEVQLVISLKEKFLKMEKQI